MLYSKYFTFSALYMYRKETCTEKPAPSLKPFHKHTARSDRSVID